MKGLTVEEIIEYQRTHKPVKHVYGKWGNLKYQYLKDIGVDWTIADLPTLLHGVDKAANKLWDVMYEKVIKGQALPKNGRLHKRRSTRKREKAFD